MSENNKQLCTLLIVDDEPGMLQGLSQNIDWNAIGYRVVALLDDGLAAIDYLVQYKVDVILTDIKMKGATGLDIAKYVHENKLPSKVVLLSGYREFEDARRALDYNVQHYITKPFILKDLRETMGDISDSICITREKREEQAQTEAKIQRFMKESFFFEAVLGALSSEHIYKYWIDTHGFSEQLLLTPCLLIRIKCIWDSKELYQVLYNYFGERFLCIVPMRESCFQALFILSEKDAPGGENLVSEMENVIKGAEVLKTNVYPDARTLSLKAGTTGGQMEGAAQNLAGSSIDSVCHYVQEHYAEKITLTTAARQVNLNATYLSRIFSEQTGYNFRDYVTNIRIQAAARLLVTTEEPVYRICDLIGYNDVKNFYSQFKKIMHITPKEYRYLVREGSYKE